MTVEQDIVILGGGLVGLSTLLALPPEWQARTRLLDAAPAPDLRRQLAPPGIDDRGTALNRSSLELLDQWGVLSPIEHSLGAIHHIEVSQEGYWGVTDLVADHTPWGAVVNNRWLGHALAERAAESAAELTFDTRAQQVRMHADQATLSLDNGQTVATRLLILADGGRSGLTEQLGISMRQHDYQQVAITLNIERERAADGRAYERFSAQGPRALLPLAGNRQTVVWVVPAQQAGRVMSWPDAAWQRLITDCFGFDQGAVTAVSMRSQYALTYRKATETARPRLALVGNGALSLHPVAGQGFNLHLRSLNDLATHLDPSDPGAIPALAAWEQRTRKDQSIIGGACHSLVQLFAPQHPVFSHARGLGLAAFNALAPARRLLTRRAMGVN